MRSRSQVSIFEAVSQLARAMEETAAPVGAKEKVKGVKSLPKGIIENKELEVQPGVMVMHYQARVSWREGGKLQRRFIPGLFDSIEKAVTAQSEAEQTLASGGTIWNVAVDVQRNKRGQVRTLNQVAGCAC